MSLTDSERLEIEWACTRLINLYVLRNDAGDWDGVAALYTDDGLMTRPSAPDQPIVGRDTILASLKGRPPRASRHVVANIVVDAESATQARAMSVILLFMGTAGEPGALPVRDPKGPLVGYYTDRFTKTADGWRFAERRGALDFAP